MKIPDFYSPLSKSERPPIILPPGRNMPTYSYACDACGHKFEKFQPITETPIRKCPKCGRLKARRVITGGGGILFKGSGFYQTDYRSKSYQEAAKKDKPESKSPNETGSSGPSAGKQPDVRLPEKKGNEKKGKK